MLNTSASSSSSLSTYRDPDSMSPTSFLDEQSASDLSSYLGSAYSSPISFGIPAQSPSSSSGWQKVDSCRDSIKSPFSRLKIDVAESDDENTDPNVVWTVKDPDLSEMVQGVNLKSPLLRVSLLSREKQLNEVFVIQRTVDEVAVAIFKPADVSSGSEVKLGLTGSVKDAMRHEIIASKLAGKLTRAFILPTAEAAALRVGQTSSIEMMSDDASSSPVSRSIAALVPGTLHKFVANSRALKDCGPQAAAFFNSQVAAVKQRTQLIAALHILTVYLDGNAGNLLLDESGYPVAIDFAEILPPRFKVGARPPCWLQAKACGEPFDSAVRKEIAQLQWSDIEEVFAAEADFPQEKKATLNLSFALLQKGAEKGLTPNHLASFIIGERVGVFEKEFRTPSAMHLIYNGCIVNGQVDAEILDKLLNVGMDFVVKVMAPVVGDVLYAYQEEIAKLLKVHLTAVLSC